MKLVILAAVAALAIPLASPLAAQLPLTATWRADTVLRAHAVKGSTDVVQTLPVGTDLSAGTSFAAVAWTSPFGNDRGTFTATYARPADGSVVIVIDERAEAFAWIRNGESGLAELGTHGTRLRIVPAVAAPVTVRVTYETLVMTIAEGVHEALIDVDVDGDGVRDFRATTGETRTQSFVVNAPAAGLDVVTATRVHTRTAGGFGVSSSPEHRGRTTIEVIPPAGTFFRWYGTGCGLPITGLLRFRSLVRDVVIRSTGPSDAIGLEVVGFTRTALPIPGTACMLLNDAPITLPFRYGVSGSVEIVHSVPIELLFKIDAQLFALEPATAALLGSNGLEIETK